MVDEKATHLRDWAEDDLGRCPKCEGNDLDYGAPDFDDGQVAFPYKCNNCGFEGKEWSVLTFSSHTHKSNDPIEYYVDGTIKPEA